MLKMLRNVVCLAVAISTGLIAAAPALAAPALTLSTGTEPTESIATQLQASGTTTNSQTSLGVTVKPTGGPGCAANFSADESAGGRIVFDGSDVEEGAFSKSVNETFSAAGSYLLCGWLNDNSQVGSPIVATASLTFTVRRPHLALSISAPPTVQPGQTFQLLTTAQAEVARTVSEYVLPETGRGCPANAEAAYTTSGVTAVFWAAHGSAWNVIGGPFTESVNEVLRSPGHYLVCAYIQYPTSQSPPEITASAAVVAVAPPPPCVVPKLTSTTTPKAVEQALAAAGCSVGMLRYAASRGIRSGYVSALSQPSGKHLPGGTAVNVTISTGPPCVVPHISAGTPLVSAEHRIRLAHCAVGHLRAIRSRRYRRGRVLRLGSRPGQVLASHAPVEIVER